MGVIMVVSLAMMDNNDLNHPRVDMFRYSLLSLLKKEKGFLKQVRIVVVLKSPLHASWPSSQVVAAISSALQFVFVDLIDAGYRYKGYVRLASVFQGLGWWRATLISA